MLPSSASPTPTAALDPRRRVSAALPLLAALCATPLHAQFQGLGSLMPDGYTEAHALSGDGSTVVGLTIDAVGDWRSFRWTAATGMQVLPAINPEWSSGDAYGVSYDGSVIVGEDYNLGSEDGGTRQGYLWTAGPTPSDPGTTQGLPYVDTSYSFASARAVSADGSVVVGMETGGAFRWTSATGAVLIGGENSEALGVSGDGGVVVGTSENQAFRWTEAGGLQTLAMPAGSTGSEAFAVSADGGTIVGTYSTEEDWMWTEHAFAWTENGVVTLEAIPGEFSSSHAHAVSADGVWAVGHSGESYAEVATLWDTRTGQIWDLNVLLTQIYGEEMLGWSLQFATGISADGRVISGYGLGPNGYEAWIVHLPFAIPEPASWATLAGLAAAGFATRRRRRSL